jgi:DNA-binding Lrp family transcriptional regulator
MLTDLEKRVILALQRDLEVEPRPFKELADLLGLEEEVVLDTIRGLMAKDYIRRFGATLRHQKSGFEANALVAWKVPEADIKRIGQEMAAQRVVSHCYYRRPAPPDWPYNLYTMVHGRTKEECLETAARMARETGLSEYQVLFSESELKKTTMRYFREEAASS